MSAQSNSRSETEQANDAEMKPYAQALHISASKLPDKPIWDQDAMLLQSYTPHVESPMTNTLSTLSDPLAHFQMMPSKSNLRCDVTSPEKVERAIYLSDP